jgi:hypothetical protein
MIATDWPDTLISIRLMHIACRITKAKDTNSECVLINILSWLKQLLESSSVKCFAYIACHFAIYILFGLIELCG